MDLIGLYPTWFEPGLGSGWIVGVIATIHVLFSHTSVGAAIFFAFLAHYAHRHQRPDALCDTGTIRRFIMGELIGLIIFGAIIGALARLFMKGEQPIGVLWTIILGVLGALAGYWITGLVGVDDTNGIDWIRWIVSIILSVVFISIYLSMRGKKR